MATNDHNHENLSLINGLNNKNTYTEKLVYNIYCTSHMIHKTT